MAGRDAPPAQGTQRLDKWLWHARFYKTRGLASRALTSGGFRINRQPVAKASAHVRAGDVLTFVQADRVRVVEVLSLGGRRGPASEAQALYHDITVGEGAPVPPPAPAAE